jgi:hypothetical protein
MEENTAFDIAREWLSRFRASDERAGAIADTFQRTLPQPEAHAIAEDKRLVLLAGHELYIHHRRRRNR